MHNKAIISETTILHGIQNLQGTTCEHRTHTHTHTHIRETMVAGPGLHRFGGGPMDPETVVTDELEGAN